MSEENLQILSFHAKLIQVVVEEWGTKSLFEQNSEAIKKELGWMLLRYLPFLRCNVSWNDDPSLIDKNMISGQIYFFNENDEKKNVDFTILNTGTNFNEYEKN